MTVRANAGASDVTLYATGEIQLSLTLSVDDPGALWNAAMQCCAQGPDGMTLDDIIEMIGPREDPSVEDCIKMLALSSSFSGCAMTDIDTGRVMVAHKDVEGTPPGNPPSPGLDMPLGYGRMTIAPIRNREGFSRNLR
jgi:hypothetical protein